MDKRGRKPKGKKITVHIDVLDDAQAITFHGRAIGDSDWLRFESVDGTFLSFNPKYVVWVEVVDKI